jgi:hypothetical protein
MRRLFPMFALVLATGLPVAARAAEVADASQCGAWMEKFDLAPYKSWGSTPGNVQKIWDASDCNHKVCQYMKDKYGVTPYKSWGSLPGNLQAVWDTKEVDCNHHVNGATAAVEPAPAVAPVPAPPPAAPVVVGNSSRLISTDKRVYKKGEPVKVNYFGMPGGAMDWTNVAKADDGTDEWGNWEYTSGANGSRVVKNLKPGEYEARAYFNNSTSLEDKVSFTVVP